MKQIMFAAVLVIFIIGLTQFTIAEEKKTEPVTTMSITNTMSISMPESWYTTITSDTEILYDVESATYNGTEFMITLKINETAIDKVSGKELDKIKNTMKVKMRDDGRNSLLATNDIYSDYNKSTGKVTYSYNIPADYVTETLVDTYNETGYVNGTELKDVTIVRKEVILKLGDNSIYITATLGTDLKIVQTGLDNTTNYVAGIDVSKGILVSSSDSTDYDLITGLVLYQSFNHGNYTGTWGTEAIDLSAENNHGTLTNMNIGLDNASSGWTSSGNQSYGMDFDGANDYINCNNDASLNLYDIFTINVWLYPNGVSENGYIIAKGNPVTSRRYNMYWKGASDKILLMIQGTEKGSSAVFTESQEWVLATIVVNNTAISFYKNGVAAGTGVISSNLDSNTAELYLGNRVGGTSVATYFNGTIDEVKLYNRALSPDEINASYQLGLPTHSSNTNVDYLSSSAVTYDTVMHSNLSCMADIPETEHNFTFNPTNIIENQTTVTFNTTDAGYFGQETVTVTPEYLNEQNLTRIRVSNPYAMNQYDLLNFNLTSYLGWNPDEIINVWYDSYTGNTDNSTLKDTNDWNTWVDTCESNTNGLVGCWNFNELDGTIAKDRANSSQNNNDGTLTNMNLGVDNASSGWTRDGKFGGAMSFDGDNDYVDCGNDASLNVYEIVTMSAWVYPATASEGGYVLAKGNPTAVWRYNMYWEGSANKLKMSLGGGGDIDSDAVFSEIDEWVFVAITIENLTVRFYKNGVAVGVKELSQLFESNIDDLLFGNRVGGTVGATHFNGTIDEVKIYNRVLSASEISGEYNLKRDYFDSIPKEESGLSASENWDMFVTNGSISSCIVPSVNFDWTITDVCEKDNEDIELGTGSMIIDATLGGLLVLKNGATVYCNDIQLIGSGQHINIFSGDIIT